MSAARSRVVQPAPAFEQAASGQSCTSSISGSRSRSTPSVASSSSSQASVVRSSNPLVDAIPRLVRGSPRMQSAKETNLAAVWKISGSVWASQASFAGQNEGCRKAPVRAWTASASSRRASHSAAPALRVSRQPRIGVSAFQSSSTATRLCAKHEVASGSSSESTRWTAAATSLGSSASYSSCRTSPAGSPRLSKRWARTEDEPTSSASTLTSAATRAPRRARPARGRRSGRSARGGPRRAGARS